jgi:hypothetical protein
MKQFKAIIFLLLIANKGICQTMPETDIFIADCRIKEGNIYFGGAKNITSRKGYDNQPNFLNDTTLLFTSIRNGLQSDIFQYTISSQKTSKLTSSAESEYSPKITPDKLGISTVVVEKDSTQRLWRYTLQGNNPLIIAKSIDSIGYYCWLSDTTFAAIMITDPSSLKICNTITGASKNIATNVGRSLEKSANGYLYFSQLIDSTRWLVRLEKDGTIQRLIEFYKQAEDFTLTRNNTVLCAHEGELFYADNNFNLGWRVCGNFSFAGAKNITRIALSPDEKHIAFVNLEEAK